MKTSFIDEYNDIIEKYCSHLRVHQAKIEFIKRDCNVKCKCENNANWNAYKQEFREFCSNCKPKSIDSEKAKKIYKKQTEYTGSFFTSIELKDIFESINIQQYWENYKYFNTRKLLKDYPKVYHSIIKNTQHINENLYVGFHARTLAILNNENGLCKICNNKVLYSRTSQHWPERCTNCTPSFGSIKYFQYIYPNEWEEKYNESILQRKKYCKGMHSEEWYIKRFGEEGKTKFNIHIDRMLSKKSSKSFSKISTELFNNIVESNKIYSSAIYGLNELRFKLSSKYSNKLGQKNIFVDFCYGNKIIEYNGSYWHKDTIEKDLLRVEFLKTMGYDVLTILDEDYKKDKPHEINKCLRFLEGNKVQNRFQIETKTGFEDFDDIRISNEKRLKFITTNASITVSENHIFMVNGFSLLASTFKIGDFLEYNGVNDKILDIINVGFGEVAEPLEVKNNTYIAGGINNHNCGFVGSSYTLISADKLKNLQAKTPIEIVGGKLKIYEEYVPGHKYICSVDPAKDGVDGFVVNFVDITNLKLSQVATANLDIDYLLMPKYLYDWCAMYGNPYLIIENNEGAGQSVADQMKITYEYENLHYDVNKNQKNLTKAKKKYPGTRTKSNTRNQILKTLKTFIDNGNLQINDQDTINQMFTFILINEKYQADIGAKDDCIMSLALAFTIFNDIKNFSDMKAITEVIEDVSQDAEIDISNLITIGSFDDSPELLKIQTEITYEGFDDVDFEYTGYNSGFDTFGVDELGDFEPNEF